MPFSSQPQGAAGQRADVLLVTVTDTETRAVLDIHREQGQQAYRQVFTESKSYFDLGTIGGASTFLVRSEMGTSGLGASQQTVSASISDLKPASIVMLGIAFGIRTRSELQLGDVLVARQLLLYESQRVGAAIRLRGDRPAASPRLLDRFRSGAIDWDEAHVHFGLLFSGEKLIDQPDFLQQLLTFEPEAIGGEMEGAGLYTAAQIQHTDWLLVKAISDWADGKKSDNKQQNQERAARKAASFVFHVLRQGGLASAGKPPQQTPASLRDTLTQRLSFEELRTICFDLGIDAEDLGGEGKAAKVRELIRYLEQRQAIGRLLDWLRQERPDIAL